MSSPVLKSVTIPILVGGHGGSAVPSSTARPRLPATSERLQNLPVTSIPGSFLFFFMIPGLSIPLYDQYTVDHSTFPSDRERDNAFYNLDTLCTRQP